MNKQEAIQQAIARIKGQPVEPGTIIASNADPISYAFLRYDGENAVVDDNKGGERSFPRSEIFDLNKLKNVANHLLNIGFWEEGMEHGVLEVSRR